ncbi:MAG: outer membrane protein assembly factor BamA [Candidatus Acidiferrales bacterium]
MVALLAVATLLLFSFPAFAQITRIEEVRWEGLRRIPRDTMNARILTKGGDVYNPDVLKRDFQAVWNTNFFEDVRLEVEDGERGKIVYFIVVERPLIRRIEYEGVKSVQQSEILERFRERRVGLSVEMQYDPTRIRRAEVVLKELLSERGRHFAKVGHVPRRVPPNAVILTFVVEEGPKVKVGQVAFQGNRHFSDRRLVRAMKNSRPYGIPMVLPLISKTYHAGKINDDLERVRELYQEHGYFRVIVQPPDERIRDTNPQWPLGEALPWFFKPGKAVDMRVRVEEGSRYRMGKLTVKSASPDSSLFFRPEFLQAAFPLKEGDIFNAKKVRDALQNYTKIYGEFGFINMTTIPNTDIDDLTRTIDMELEVDTGKQFFVNRIEFVGNTTTRDKVIRRELLVEEGAIFNSRLWEASVLRLNQLGYFEELRPEHADVQQNAERGEVDLALKVKERGKNTIGLTGGASGVLGSFLGLNYETNNFLGLGETLSLNIEWGDRQQGFVFGFTEPYLFDRPLSGGFSFFIRRFDFDQARETAVLTGTRLGEQFASRLLNYTQDSIGFSVFASYAPKRFRWTRLGLTYAYDNSDVTCISESCQDLFERLQFSSLVGPSSLEGIRSSRVTPTYYYSTVNHTIFPTGGTSIFAGLTFEGGPLGGNQKSFRPTFELKHFRPINKGRNTLAFRFQAAFITGYGGRVPSPFNRFYTGGEDSIRGFDIRAVSPLGFLARRATVPFFFLDPTRLDPNGNPTLRFTTVEVLSQQFSFPGGDTQLLFNFEYRIPIAGPVQIAPFIDFGWNGIWRRSQLRQNPEAIAEFQQVFPGVTFPENVELVPGTNFHPRASTGLELVVFVPILNVPFRVYWAYNPLRLSEGIRVPAASFAVPEDVVLPPGVFETQILPSLGVVFQERIVRFDEPVKTFRFTVSRTF